MNYQGDNLIASLKSLWGILFENADKFKLYLFYNDYETSYTTYINHTRWHRCLRSNGLRVGGNWSTWRKPICLTWWPHDHLTCRCQVLNPGCSGERRARYHYASQAVISTDRQTQNNYRYVIFGENTLLYLQIDTLRKPLIS